MKKLHIYGIEPEIIESFDRHSLNSTAFGKFDQPKERFIHCNKIYSQRLVEKNFSAFDFGNIQYHAAEVSPVAGISGLSSAPRSLQSSQ